MLDRLNFLVVYVGSAAVVAFLAACMSSPQVYSFRCEATDAGATERCERTSSAAAATTGEADTHIATQGQQNDLSWESVTMAALH